ncbi:MBOAT-domain-containing protein [Thozetella sp. PMI_491]|nr:MBOAT-domain-containing protein [Thozetella sp. PMI_491]
MLPYINAPFVYLGGLVGTGPDELKLIFSFLISYPLAGLLKRVPDARPEQKNIFIISVGIFYLVGLFDLWDGLRTVLISSGGSYAIAKFLRGSPYMPWINFVFIMGHMSISHLARQAANTPSVIDITGSQMVLVMKLTAFCWNVADGALPDDQLSDIQRDRRLVELPNLFDYASYIFFFPSLMAGPAFDYAEFRRWLDCSMFDVPAAVDPAKKPPTRKKRRIPRSGIPAMVKMATGLAWIGLFVNLSGSYSYPALLTDDFLNLPFLRRVFVMYLVNLTARTKYYGVWTLTEGSCILAGLGYNGVDPVTGKVSWNRLQNIDPLGVELAQNTRAYLGGWNQNTNNWLRHYVYLRVTPRGKKPGFRASLATFTTSALWHGFYPGYYLTFVLASFIQTVAKNFRRYFRPFFLHPKTQAPLPSKRYYDFFSWLATQLAFSFTTTPFLTLTMSASLTAWQGVYYYAAVGTAVSIAFFASPAKAYLRKTLEARAAKAGVDVGGQKRPDGLHRTISTDSLGGREPVLGLSTDPERELDEAINEIKAELEKKEGERKKQK